jgi:hypothetical protein
VTATVEDSGTSWRVSLMPALRDGGVMQAACECTEAEDSACEHVWAVLRLIDARRIWPRDVAVPTDVEVSDSDDSDFELISVGSGVAITGVRQAPALTAKHEPARVIDVPPVEAPRSWRELVYAWPRRPVTGRSSSRSSPRCWGS